MNFTVLSGATLKYIEQYSTTNGLSQSQAESIAEDERGMIWLGTRAGGINRIDGFNIKNNVYNENIKDSAINSILTKDEYVYFATGAGLYLIDKNENVKFIPSSLSAFISLKKYKQKILALRRTSGKDALYEVLENSVNSMNINLPDGSDPLKLYISSKGEILIATRSAGIYKVNGNKLERIDGTEKYLVTDICESSNGEYIFADAKSGVYKIAEGGIEKFININGFTPSTLYKDSDGLVYVGTDAQGFFIKYPDGKEEYFSNDSGVPRNKITFFFEDRNGNIWMGLDGKGVMVLPPMIFVNFTDDNNLFGPFTFFQVDEHKIIAGGIGGVSLLDKATETIEFLNESCTDQTTVCALKSVYSYADIGDFVYVGNKEGLFKVDKQPPYKIEKVKFQIKESLISKDFDAHLKDIRVFKVIKYNENLILMASETLLKYNYINGTIDVLNICGENNNKSCILSNISIHDDNLAVLTIDKEFFTYNLKTGKKEGFNSEIEDIAGEILKISYDKDGNIWAGTQKDIYKIDVEKNLKKLDNPQDFSFGHVYFIFESSDKNIWIGANNGVYLIKNDVIVYHYSYLDGLLKQEANTDSVFEDSNGDIWLGMENSAAWLRKELKNKIKSIPPKIYMNWMKVYDEKISSDKALNLAYHENYLTFSYISPAPADPKGVYYNYILEGFDPDWSKTTLNEMRYTNLPPGDYIFKVKAFDRFGTESPELAQMKIKIKEPFWNTLLFKISVTALCLSLILFYIHLSTKNVKLRSETLEKIVTERTDQLLKEIEKSRTHLIEIEKLKKKFERLSTVDELTGLYNRRFFFDRIDGEMARIQRAKTYLGILIVDIDHFKHTNDTYGHPVGDKVLIALSSILMSGKRKSDIIARFGGEEFIVACELPNPEELGIIAERLRSSVDAANFRIGEGKTIKKTISVGGAIWTPQSVLIDDVIKTADTMLYRAKESGRNRYVIAEEIIVTRDESNIIDN